MIITDNPVRDMERHQLEHRILMESRTPKATCKYCGHTMWKDDDVDYEDERPYHLVGEKIWLHEGCIMDYAREHWRVEG